MNNNAVFVYEKGVNNRKHKLITKETQIIIR